MTVDEACEALAQVPGTTFYAGASGGDLERLAEAGIRLPAAHVELLSRSNGLLAYDGYLRFFGIGDAAPVCMLRWNSPGLWKFAWAKDEPHRHFCFAETAFGVQFAYLVADLLVRTEIPPVYFLCGNTMHADVECSCFEEWLEFRLVRLARDRPLSDENEANLRFGSIDARLHVALVPPMLMTIAAVTPDRFVLMDSVEDLIGKGDVMT